jgi:hypothetical protein
VKDNRVAGLTAGPHLPVPIKDLRLLNQCEKHLHIGISSGQSDCSDA